jgi:hypothetical protein
VQPLGQLRRVQLMHVGGMDGRCLIVIFGV